MRPGIWRPLIVAVWSKLHSIGPLPASLIALVFVSASNAYSQVEVRPPTYTPTFPSFPGHVPVGGVGGASGTDLLLVLLVFVIGIFAVLLVFLGLGGLVAALSWVGRQINNLLEPRRRRLKQQHDVEYLIAIYTKGNLTKRFGMQHRDVVANLVDDLRDRRKLQIPAGARKENFKPELITSELVQPGAGGVANIVIRYDGAEIVRFAPGDYRL